MIEPKTFQPISGQKLLDLPQVRALPADTQFAMRVVATVLPFRVNNHVLEELIDWSRVPDDPMFRLVFPQPGQLEPQVFDRVAELIKAGADEDTVQREARAIQTQDLNPHPAGQLEHNVPLVDGVRMDGIQHKYRETVLFFPSQGQTCHAYCGYCFRWAQFVGIDELKFASREAEGLASYLREHPEVTDVLLTGGDPMVMRTRVLERYIEPLLTLDHVQSIRIGTKALAWWPYRFVTDKDSDDLMRLFERVRGAGKRMALMAHASHPVELEPKVAREAVRRIQDTGAVIRCQAPLVRHVNDDPEVWADLWREEVRLGMVPYYMFVERDTGARAYYHLPLTRALEIYREALRRTSGLARTVRGPSMSADPGKVCLDSIERIAGEEVFVLRFLQSRNPDWSGRTFFARYDPSAAWLNELQPAFGESKFFFEESASAVQAQSRIAESV
ncbi:MAG: lysine 2,3-aminomutase [Planctomycetes bacterium]|nr:lysine 2,3-aminomutase [Planctomycetota bacterium]